MPDSKNVEIKEGYMCMTDFYHELGEGPDCKIYSSLASLTSERLCVRECGIVKVSISLTKVIQDSDFNHIGDDYE